FSSLRTSLRNSRARSNRPPAACRTLSNVVVSAITSTSDFRLLTSDFEPTRVRLRSCVGWLAKPEPHTRSLRRGEGWQARRESNPQPPVLETGALPIELLAYPIAECGVRSVD